MADIVDLNPAKKLTLEELNGQYQARLHSVGRGRLPQRLSKPIIYFAGRLNMACKDNDRDWRAHINELKGEFFEYHDNHRRYDSPDPDKIFDCGQFWYGGPFPNDITGGHTVGHGYHEDHDTHCDIWEVDTHQIERADLVVAYISDLHAYGTLVEIGYAAGKGKPIVLGFSDDLSFDEYMELWLCRMPAARIYRGTPEVVWQQIWSDWIGLPRF